MPKSSHHWPQTISAILGFVQDIVDKYMDKFEVSSSAVGCYLLPAEAAADYHDVIAGYWLLLTALVNSICDVITDFLTPNPSVVLLHTGIQDPGNAALARRSCEWRRALAWDCIAIVSGKSWGF